MLRVCPLDRSLWAWLDVDAVVRASKSLCFCRASDPEDGAADAERELTPPVTYAAVGTGRSADRRALGHRRAGPS